jgi:hypothetical protein
LRCGFRGITFGGDAARAVAERHATFRPGTMSMDALFLIMRVVHVACGVFWAGTLIFNALFLVPSVRDAGPEGAKVSQALMRRRFLDVMPVIALLTILSGLWLYWRLSSGFSSVWVTSPLGLTLGIGAALAIIAFTIGVGLMRPAMLRAAALGQTLASLPEGPERAARQAQVQQLRERAMNAGRYVAALLTAAVVAMGAARYL